MQIEARNIKNILVVRNDRFGEFLLNIPAFRALKETFVNARLIAVVSSSVKELAECVLPIDETIEWSHGGHPLKENLRLISLFKAKRIDMAIMLNPSKEFNILTLLAGIPIRVGYNRKWGFLLTHKMEDKKYLGRMHEIEYNLELVSLVGAKAEDKTLSLVTDGNEIAGALKDFNIEDYCRGNRNLIALHPQTSDPIKQWPQEYFIELARMLTSDPNITIVVIGSKDELCKSEENFYDNLVNLTGKTTLRQLAVILKKCRLLISCDSGPVHLASSVGIPSVAIFRSDMPAKSSVRWGPRGKGSIVIEKERLSDISVDEVFGKVKEILGGIH